MIVDNKIDTDKYIYNWNLKKNFFSANLNKMIGSKDIEINDETLRDGLQATYIRHPNIEEKQKLILLMESLGIESANIGFPAASSHHFSEVVAIAKYVKDNNLKINLGCAARTFQSDIEAIVKASQESGIKLNAGLFIGSSKMRFFVEKWDLHELGQTITKSVKFAIDNNLDVMFVTEDTTRAHPETVEYLYEAAIESGATRICVSDTVGYSTPWATYNLISFIRSKILHQYPHVKMDWHGHNDRGLALANSLIAVFAGADRIQGTALGIGERAGNTAIEELLVNLHLEGLYDNSIDQLNEYINYASNILNYKVPVNKAIAGQHIFSTSTGVHAAAMKKAQERGSHDLAGLIYSAFNPGIIQRDTDILVGPMSGKANVELALKKKNINYDQELVNTLLQKVKQIGRVVTADELELLIDKLT